MRRTIHISILLLLGLCLSGRLGAQTSSEVWTVESFARCDLDMDAKINFPVEDSDGDKCAIIKVETPYTGFNFDTGVLKVIRTVQRPGEIWVYVPKGVMKLTIGHEKGVLREYLLPETTAEGVVYSLKLKYIASSAVVDINTAPGADISIDGKKVGSGGVVRDLKEGDYVVSVSKAGCETATQVIRVKDGQNITVSIFPVEVRKETVTETKVEKVYQPAVGKSVNDDLKMKESNLKKTWYSSSLFTCDLTPECIGLEFALGLRMSHLRYTASTFELSYDVVCQTGRATFGRGFISRWVDVSPIISIGYNFEDESTPIRAGINVALPSFVPFVRLFGRIGYDFHEHEYIWSAGIKFCYIYE
jgi:hypothetical protein